MRTTQDYLTMKHRFAVFERHFRIVASATSLSMVAACASPQAVPTTDQPALAELAQPYAAQLRAVGITRVVSPGTGAMVRLDTGYGAVYVPYPASEPPLAFELDIGPVALHASARAFDRSRDERVLAALIPPAIRLTAANNDFGWQRANPWH